MNYFDKYIKYKTKYLKHQKYIGGSAAVEVSFVDKITKDEPNIKEVSYSSITYVNNVDASQFVPGQYIDQKFLDELKNLFVEPALFDILYCFFGHITKFEEQLEIYNVSKLNGIQDKNLVEYRENKLYILFGFKIASSNTLFYRLMIFNNVELNIENFICMYAIFLNYFNTINYIIPSIPLRNNFHLYDNLSTFMDSLQQNPVAFIKSNMKNIGKFIEDNKLSFTNVKQIESIKRMLSKCKEIY